MFCIFSKCLDKAYEPVSWKEKATAKMGFINMPEIQTNKCHHFPILEAFAYNRVWYIVGVQSIY